MAHPMIGKWHSRLIRDDGVIVDDGEFNFTDIDDNDVGRVNAAQHTLGGTTKTVTGNVRRVANGFRFGLTHDEFGSTTGALRNYGAVLVLSGGSIIFGDPVFTMLVGRKSVTPGTTPPEDTESVKAVTFADQLDGTVVITRP